MHFFFSYFFGAGLPFSNGVIFEREVVLPPRRTAMCLFADGGLDAVKAVPAKGNEEVKFMHPVRCSLFAFFSLLNEVKHG